MTSANLLHVHAPLRGNDLLLLVFPGLISLGVKAELVQISAESRWKATLRDRLRMTPGVSALRLSAPLPEPPDPPEAPPRNAYTHLFPEVIEPVVEDLITITAVEESLFYFHRDKGETETIREMDFSRRFTHLVRLQRTGERNAPLQENIRDVLSRTIAYAAAYPDRIIRGGEAAPENCSEKQVQPSNRKTFRGQSFCSPKRFCPNSNCLLRLRTCCSKSKSDSRLLNGERCSTSLVPDCRFRVP